MVASTTPFDARRLRFDPLTKYWRGGPSRLGTIGLLLPPIGGSSCAIGYGGIVDQSYTQAVERVKAFLESDLSIVGEGTETSYGWVFTVATDQWLAGDPDGALIGRKRIVVERDSRRLFWWPDIHPGAGEDWESVERDVAAAMEAGFRYGWCDLTIERVMDPSITLDLLEPLSMRYVIPEVDEEITWTIPQEYAAPDLTALIAHPPVTFTMQPLGFHDAHRLTSAFDATRCCEYSWKGIDPPIHPFRHTGPQPPIASRRS